MTFFEDPFAFDIRRSSTNKAAGPGNRSPAAASAVG